MDAEIVSIGNEILIGMISDTNSTWICEKLASHGIPVTRQTAVGDDLNAVVDAVLSAAARAELVIVNGGIGPTVDDVTRQAVANAAGVGLRLDEEWLTVMQGKFKFRGIEMPPSNEIQAMIPETATRIFNPVGTAAGFFVKIEGAEVAVFPGVPSELKEMFAREYLPGLLERVPTGEVLVTRTLKCFGLPESLINERIENLMGPDMNPKVGLLAKDSIITVKLTAAAESERVAVELIDSAKVEIRDRLGDAVFGDDGDELQTAVARLLSQHKLTVATAESCTGGLVSQCLTQISGSSTFFLGGAVSYSNEAKNIFLDVPMELFETKGAVSAEVAEAMAEGIRRRLGADYGISLTGIAGPTGGTAEKPVGLVYLGLCGPEFESGEDPAEAQIRTQVFEMHLSGTRDQIRDRAAKYALNELRMRLL